MVFENFPQQRQRTWIYMIAFLLVTIGCTSVFIPFQEPTTISLPSPDPTLQQNIPITPTQKATQDQTNTTYKIAFSTFRDSDVEIYVMSSDGSDQVRLINSAGLDDYPSWSPDGTKIAYVNGRGSRWQLYVMDSDGSDQVSLTKNLGLDVGSGFMWSPDGKKIVFTAGESTISEIYTMNSDGSNQVKLTDYFSPIAYPVWSPNGTKIAYVFEEDDNLNDYQAGNNDIYVMNADGTNNIQLTTQPGMDTWPVWSPDGTKIAFVSDRDENYEIYSMNADGTNQTNLSNNSDNLFAPTWSPDGTKIAFESDRDGNNEIYVMNADGTNQTNLSNRPQVSDVFPAWSPDGTKIAFRSDDQDGISYIITVNADGSDLTNLTEDGNWFSWSPLLH